MYPRYYQAKRRQRSELLSEMEQVTKMHRKSLTRLLNGQSLERKKRRKTRPSSYGLEVERIVLRVWESLDYLCAERLTPSLLALGRHRAGFGVVRLTPELEEQLQSISTSTVQRILRKHRSDKRRSTWQRTRTG